jgi:hypothetical protein
VGFFQKYEVWISVFQKKENMFPVTSFHVNNQRPGVKGHHFGKA